GLTGPPSDTPFVAFVGRASLASDSSYVSDQDKRSPAMTPKSERALASLWRQRRSPPRQPMRLREGAFGRAPTFGRVASYRAAKTPRDRAACGVSSHSGDGRSRGASGEGVSSSPAMERAASAPAEPCASPVASVRWVVRRRQPPCPPATSHAEAHPRLLMRQSAAAVRRGNPPAAGPPL